MTITCTCPKCDRFCGFKDAYAGRRVRCLACNSHFIVPNHDGQTARLLTPEPEPPLPGFYRAVLLDNFKAFIQNESLLGIILCIALTCFHFFAGNEDYSFTIGGFRPPLAIGWVVTFCCAGYLLWYFMETINTTTVGNDFLPEISIGTGFVFIGEAVKSIYLFIVAFAIAAIPGAALTALLEKLGISYRWLNMTIITLSLSMLPMILCMLGSGVAPWNVFRYDRIIRIISKTFGSYVLTAMITFIAFLVIYMTIGFFATNPDSNRLGISVMLALRLLAVFMMLFTMRTIGLYARHYYHCFPDIFDK
jgi:hypothetical protein